MADSPFDSSEIPTAWNPGVLGASNPTPKLPKVSLHLSVSGTRICCAMITFWFSWMFIRENLSCKLAASNSMFFELSVGGELDFVGVPITPGLVTLDFWLDFGFHSLLCCEAAKNLFGQSFPRNFRKKMQNRPVISIYSLTSPILIGVQTTERS